MYRSSRVVMVISEVNMSFERPSSNASADPPESISKSGVSECSVIYTARSLVAVCTTVSVSEYWMFIVVS